MNAHDDTPLVTVGQVERWREEARLLRKQKEETERRLADLERRLAAASIFEMERATQAIEKSRQPPLIEMEEPDRDLLDPEPAPPATMHDAILLILRNARRPMEPKEIARVIQSQPNIGDKIKRSHPNYLYTALMRLLNRREIEKEGSSYRAVQK